MTDLDRAIAAAREATIIQPGVASERADYLDRALQRLLAALDAQVPVAWQYRHSPKHEWQYVPAHSARCLLGNGDEYRALYLAPVAPAAAVPAANVTPMRQPRTDLARLVESVKAAVYANGDGLSVTEAIGALELAKLELLKEQEQ